MKKNSKIFYGLSFFLLLLFPLTVSAHSNLTGSWEFSVNLAPWEYSKGKVIFKTTGEDDLTGKIVFTSGAEIKISKISCEDNNLTFEVIIDGYRVKTIATLKGNTMTGMVETYDGNMPFTAKKAIPEKI